nr:unnamed protein product [Spirometra erinaceieuropaei]
MQTGLKFTFVDLMKAFNPPDTTTVAIDHRQFYHHCNEPLDLATVTTGENNSDAQSVTTPTTNASTTCNVDSIPACRHCDHTLHFV